MPEEGEVTPDERLAAWDRGIRVLLVTGKHNKAAEAAGCNVMTWHGWRKEEAFQRLFEIRREQAAQVTKEELGPLFKQAVEVLLEAMGEGQKMHIRLKAAEKVLGFVGKTGGVDSAKPTVPMLEASVTPADAAARLRSLRFSDVEPAPELPPGGDDESADPDES